MKLRSNWRLPVCAILSYTLSFPCYAELTIAPGELLEIDTPSSLENFDWIDNQGEVINNSTITNYYYSQFINSGSVLNNGSFFFDIGSELNNFSDFTNAGLLILSDAYFNNYGNFHNAGGTVDLSLAASVWNTGVFDNDGQVYGANDKVFHNVGVLNNNQQLSINVDNTGTVNNNATLESYQYLINQASAVLNNYISGVVETQKLENSGELNNQGNILLLDNVDPYAAYPAAGEINNSGVFNHSGVIDTYGSAGISLVNSGEFNNNGSIHSNSGLSIQNSGVFNNNVAIIMDDYLGQNSTVVNTGVFNNNADLAGANYLENSGDFENNAAVYMSGGLVNRAGGIFNNDAGSSLALYGVLDNQGEFNNDSDIMVHGYVDSSTGMDMPAQLNNSGVFNHNGGIVFSSYPGSGLVLSNAGEFNNFGIIDGDGALTINNSGVFNNIVLIDRYIGYPVGQDSIDNSGTFNNDGGLQGFEAVTNSGVFNNNTGVGGVERLENSGNFENNSAVNVIGELVNRASGVFNNITGWLVDVTGVLDNQGEFNNQSDMTINGAYDPALGITMPGQLNNSGVFNHDGRIDAMGSQGLVINNSGEFNNQGTINGQLLINNSGTFNQNSQIDQWSNPGSEIINSGNFYNQYYLEVESLTNSGNFENNSNFETDTSLTNLNSGIFTNNAWAYMDVSAALDNQGEFNSLGAMSFYNGYDSYAGMPVSAELNNAGIFNHEVTGYIYASEDLLINNSGTFNNLGQLDVHQKLVINNSGTFNNGDSVSYGQVLNLGYQSAINNYGTFNNYAYVDGGSGTDTRLLNTGILNNQASIVGIQRFTNAGTVNNGGDIRVDYGKNMVNLNGGVINNGDVSGPYSVMVNDGTLDNRGSINNASRIDLGYGSVTSNSGSIVNNGDITGAGDINNTGSIINNYTMTGLRDITSSGQFVNNGELQAENIQVTDGVFKGNGNVYVLGDMVVTEAGTLAPGNSTGWMDIFGGLDLNGTLQMEFDWTDPSQYDQLHVSGNVVLGADSVLDISFLSDDYFSLGQSYDLMFANDINGGFGGFYYDALWDNSLALQWEIFSDYGQDILRLNVVSAVPLPATAWLFLSGAFGLMVMARRRRRLH